MEQMNEKTNETYSGTLDEYLKNGVRKIFAGALKTAINDPRELMFIKDMMLESQAAEKRRDANRKGGRHVPPFMIASITEKCNLRCLGCYAMAGSGSCADRNAQMSSEEWSRLFSEAADMGIQFILLAGGEPLMRKDVLEAAGRQKRTVFPVFTNGMLFDREYIDLFARRRNLIPFVSIEGSEDETDERRGSGVFASAEKTMSGLHARKVMFGISVTVTKNNMKEVLSSEFVGNMKKRGCRSIIYVEYVPVDPDADCGAADDGDRIYMSGEIERRRIEYDDMLLISFPGDEKASGGCLAAGRGFFHVSSGGNAEPCPFSPFSDVSVCGRPLKEALGSPFFRRLRESGIMKEEHSGGCTLFYEKDKLKNLLPNVK